MALLQTASHTGLVVEGRHLPTPHRPFGTSVRRNAYAKPARSATSGQASDQSSSGGLAWLPSAFWSRSEPAEQSQQTQPSGGIGPLLWGPSPPTPQQQPRKSKTGTQLFLPWGKGGSEQEAVTSSSQGSRPGTVKEATAAVQQQGATEEKPSFPYWRLPGTTKKAVAAALPDGPPIVSCAGGGIFFFWELGVMKYLMEHFDLSRTQLIGVSAGGLAVTLAECGVNPDKAIKAAFRIAEEEGVWGRPGGLVGIWGPLVRQWLEELLPEDAGRRCTGRVKLVVTEVPSLRLQYIDRFESKQDVIDANMASVHIPFLLDGNPTTWYRGKQLMDGSLYDFIFGNNSGLITCGGNAFVVDYFTDDQLQYSRLDFLKLSDIESVLKLERAGYAFAERMDETGGLDYHLESVRKGPVRRLVEFPVRQVARVFA